MTSSSRQRRRGRHQPLTNRVGPHFGVDDTGRRLIERCFYLDKQRLNETLHLGGRSASEAAGQKLA